MNRVRRAAQTWMRRALAGGQRATCCAVGILALAVSGTAAAGGTGVFFGSSFYSANANQPLSVDITTNLLGTPAGGGTVSFDTSLCSAPPMISGPATANGTGITNYQFVFPALESCNITVNWDPDGAGPDPVVSDISMFQVDDYSIVVDQDPGALINPLSPNPTFSVTVLNGGTPVPGLFVRWDVTPPIGSPAVYGSVCSPSIYDTDNAGRSTYSFADSPAQARDQFGVYMITITPGDGGNCAINGVAGDDGAGAKGVFGSFPSLMFMLQNEDLELVFDNPPTQVVSGQPAAFPVQLRGVSSMTGISGQTVNWSASPSGIVTPLSGNVVTDGSGFGVITLTGGTPDLMGGFLNALVSLPLPTPNDARTAGASFVVADLNLAVSTPAPTGPTFSDEQAAGFSVVATSNTGNTDDPASGVPITFSITSGNGTFVGGGSSAVVNTDTGGMASSPAVVMGRSNGPVVVQADGGAYGVVSQNYSVQASSYTLTAVGTPASQDIDISGSAPLAVRLERAGSSTPVALAAESINWQVSPNDGSFVSPAPTTTDGSGLASASFIPANSGSYVVTGSFATGFTTDPTQSFTVNVTAPVLTLDAVSGDGQTGDPGTTLPSPLVVQALDDGLPPSSGLVEWSASGGVTLTGSSSPGPLITETLDVNGRSSVQVTLPEQPGTFTVTATRVFGQLKGLSLPGPSVTFTVTGGAEDEPFVQAFGGTSRVGIAGSSGETLEARVLIGREPAVNKEVNWAVIEGTATVVDSTSRTNDQGVATTMLNYGTGRSTVRASVDSGSETFFQITAVEGTLQAVSPEQVTGTPRAALAEDFVVEVRSPSGAAVPNIAVTWTVIDGAGSLRQTETPTDPFGQARNRLTFGSDPGTTLVEASLADGARVTFTAVAVGPDGNTEFTLVRDVADPPPGLVGTRLDSPLRVRLLRNGVGVAEEEIRWEVLPPGAATLDEPPIITDSNGYAELGLKYGTVAGPFQVRASASVAPAPVLFNLSAVNPALGGTSGNGQTGTAGQPLPNDLEVNVAEPGSKGLGGVPVQWRVVSGGGTLGSTQSLSNASGIASNQWTLGSTLGEQRVAATLPGGQEILFTANATASPADGSLQIIAGDGQALPTGQPSTPLVVELRDSAGQPIPNALIEWNTDGQRVALRDTSTRTGSDGQASNIATVLIPGAASVSAKVAGESGPSVSFQLSGGIALIPGLSEREREVGAAIDNACPALAALPTRTPEQQDLFLRCSEMVGNASDNPDEVRNALGELPADVGQTMSNQGTESIGVQFDNLDTRLFMIRGEKSGGQRNQFNIGMWTPDGTLPLSFLPSAFMAGAAEDEQAGLDFDRWGFFATGQIGRGEVRAGERSPEFDYDIAGLTFGVDYRFSDRVVAGVALGYSDNDAELAGGRGDVATKGWNLSGYATWYSDNAWYVDGTLMVGRLDYDLQRRVRYTITALDGGVTTIDQVGTSSTDGDVFGTSISVGRDWQKGPWSLSSYVRGQFSRVESDAFVERMQADRPGQGLALAIDSRTTESMTSVIGGRATYILSRDWGILMPNMTLEWEHEFEDDPSRLTARFAFDPTRSVIEQFGDATDSDYFNVGIGVSALFPGGRSAYLYYEELVGASRVSQGLLSLGVRFEF